MIPQLSQVNYGYILEDLAINDATAHAIKRP